MTKITCEEGTNNQPELNVSSKDSENTTIDADSRGSSYAITPEPDTPRYRVPPTTSDILNNLSEHQEQRKETPSVLRETTSIELRKPGRFEWFRAHREEGFHSSFLLHQYDDQLYYLVPALKARYRDALKLKRLVYCINADGEVFLWPISLPDDTGELDEWSRRAHHAAERSKEEWLCYRWNTRLKRHNELASPELINEPTWPELTLDQILALAFRDCAITDADHIALKRIDGRA